MILLHLFYSAVPRVLDTPRMRLVLRLAGVALLAIVLAGAVSRAEETPAQATTTEPGPTGEAPAAAAPEGVPEDPATGAARRGNVTTVFVTGSAEEPAGAAAPAPAPGEAVASPAGGDAAAAATDEATAPESASSSSEIDTTEEAKVETAVAPLPVDAVVPAVSAAPAPAEPTREARLAPVDDFAESGRRFWRAGDFVAAERAFTRALTANEPVERKRALVLEMAGLYRGAGQLPKAAAVLETFIKTYPRDRDIPHVLLELGAIYRDLGAHSMATARFFQVLNTTLRVEDEDIPEYRRVAMKARLEIAETYASQGNLAEAERYFARLQLLDLEPADRERVLLRGAQMQFNLRQWLATEQALAGFLADHPASVHVPEARYMRAKALEELGRKQEAVEEVVALLQLAEPGDPEAARGAAYWKRRCANELANRFYEQGDFLGALAIYQALARASIEPSWRWPAIYQIGLCFERLSMPHRAAEAYDAILAPEMAPASGARLPESLASLQDMARWRRSHLVWIEDAGKQLQSLSAEKPAGT